MLLNYVERIGLRKYNWKHSINEFKYFVIDTHVKNLNDTIDREIIRDYGRDNVLNQNSD